MKAAARWNRAIRETTVYAFSQESLGSPTHPPLGGWFGERQRMLFVFTAGWKVAWEEQKKRELFDRFLRSWSISLLPFSGSTSCTQSTAFNTRHDDEGEGRSSPGSSQESMGTKKLESYRGNSFSSGILKVLLSRWTMVTCLICHIKSMDTAKDRVEVMIWRQWNHPGARAHASYKGIITVHKTIQCYVSHPGPFLLYL